MTIRTVAYTQSAFLVPDSFLGFYTLAHSIFPAILEHRHYIIPLLYLRCRGEPGAPRLAATSGGPRLQPFLRRLRSEIRPSRSLGCVSGSSRAGAAGRVSGAGRSPCPGRRVRPSPGPPELRAGRACNAAAGVLRAPGPWRARFPWPRAGRRPESRGEGWRWRLARR